MSLCCDAVSQIACSETNKNKLLKAMTLSAGEVVCCDQLLSTILMHTSPAFIEVSVQQYVFP